MEDQEPKEAVAFSTVNRDTAPGAAELAAKIHTIKCKTRLTIYLHLLEIIIRGILTLTAGQNSDQFTSMSEKPPSRGTISHDSETDDGVSAVRGAERTGRLWLEESAGAGSRLVG